MPKYDKENPMRIQAGVIPMDSHGAIIRCKVYLNLLAVIEFAMVLDAYDRVEQRDCIEHCFIIPEFDCEGYCVSKIEVLRSVHIGKKLVEHVCARTGEDFEFLCEMGEPAMIIFQDEKLKT